MPPEESYLDFAALSIDSNILRGQRYNFDGGILKQLEQFQGSPVQIVQPDVIHSEGVQHISAEIADALKAAIGNMRTLSKYSEDSKISEVGTSRLRDLNPIFMAEEKLKKFYHRINASVLASSRVSISDLMRMYFSTEAPFENPKEKKSTSFQMPSPCLPSNHGL
ncbi:PIN domain-containing protein [Pseudomonas syringae group genomosp. 3]|uniref:PIN domain-containing protein n=1 Tax=Pseudomonas syringae group genomosp. 3 TaxID=251701 RepID=UPI001F47FA07|nr:PIN domain-containing protein [Pseudomonas syringae group genomosp. 3]